MIDNNNPRKTEIVKHTYLPTWNESFTVCVTPSSEMTFRVLDRSSFLKDSLLGERNVQLAQVLEYYHGRCDNLELIMDLLGSVKPEGRAKCGELVIVLNGLRIESMAIEPDQITNASNNVTSNTPLETNVCNGRSIILSGGIRARVRSLNNSANNPALSNFSNHATADNSFVLSTRNPNDQRNICVPSSDPSNRRNNDFSDDQSQLQVRSVNNLGIVSVSCASNPNRGSCGNWESTSSCNGVSPSARNHVVTHLNYFMLY